MAAEEPYEYRVMLSVLYDQTESECPGSTWATKQPPHQFWTSLRMTSWHWLVGGFLRHRSVVHIIRFFDDSWPSWFPFNCVSCGPWKLAQTVSPQSPKVRQVEHESKGIHLACAKHRTRIFNVETKRAQLPEDQDWVSQQGGSQPVLVIQLWNKAGIWCKFRTKNLSSPWSKFIWSQGPAADESTCAHQKCCATGAEVSSGWVVVWVAFGRKIQDDPGKFRDQYQGSDLTQCAPQIPTEVKAALKQRNWLYIIRVYTIISDHWAYTAPPLVYWRWRFWLFGLRVTSIFKSWTLSFGFMKQCHYAHWFAVTCAYIYIIMLKPYPFGQSWVCAKKYITNSLRFMAPIC